MLKNQRTTEGPKCPVWCLADLPQEHHPRCCRVELECVHGGPGSTVNFWRLSDHVSRITLGFKLHPTAGFISMPNREGVITGGLTTTGFNDQTATGYPLQVDLWSQQVSSVVRFDEHVVHCLTCHSSSVAVGTQGSLGEWALKYQRSPSRP